MKQSVNFDVQCADKNVFPQLMEVLKKWCEGKNIIMDFNITKATIIMLDKDEMIKK